MVDYYSFIAILLTRIDDIYEPEPLLLYYRTRVVSRKKMRANKQSFFIKMVLQLFLPLVSQTFWPFS
jgi:hypothetical protein